MRREIPPLSRRAFLRASAIASATLAVGRRRALAVESTASIRPVKLSLLHATLPDPDGHHAALRLKGDWEIIGISDGTHTGVGEISHNGDEATCRRRVRELFDAHVAGAGATFEPTLEAIQALERGPFATAADFVTATAISGLNQALYDLAAQRAGVPVWRLLQKSGAPVRTEVPCYLTLNRALRARETADYLRAVEAAVALGVRAVKVAPFEAVTPGAGDQRVQAEAGFARLTAIRRRFPDIALRVDCHERFKPEHVRALLSRFAELRLTWLEEPTPAGPILAEVRKTVPLAEGELFFGETRFRQLLESQWADVIMPDPKHVGGFGPLVQVCRMAEQLHAQTSPHNPSGPVATAAALHAAAICPAATSVELILTSDPARQPGRDTLAAGKLRVPDAPGWGLPADIVRRLKA